MLEISQAVERALELLKNHPMLLADLATVDCGDEAGLDRIRARFSRNVVSYALNVMSCYCREAQAKMPDFWREFQTQMRR